ncbi:MAG: SH3 domain-containing protein [Lachnospiraceae bacterium]|nr:SH3 domain-containing protein [Lachnospiraceae bacterium]
MAKNKLGDLLEKHYRYLIIGGLFLILVIVLIVFFVTRKGKKDDSESGSETAVNTGMVSSTVEVPKDKYEVNAYPNVNSLMEQYYNALMNGDSATIETLCDVLSDSEKFRIEEKAKYYQNFLDFTVYTKKGYRENSYLVLVTFNILYQGTQTPAPSLDSAYVCTDPSGALYINKSELSEDEQAYLLELTVQSDVEELIEKVKVDYNKAIEGDESLAKVIDSIDTSVNEAVKARLSEQQKIEAEAAAQAEQNAQAANAVSNKVRATDVVNIRASASTDAESLGKSTVGQEFTRYEAMDNGWSKVDYNGTEAYIKSEFLEVVEAAPAGEGNAEAGTGDGAAEGASESSTSGAATGDGANTVKITSDNVNVRASNSTDSNKIGTAQKGSTYKLIEKLDGWVKIDYNGTEAYVSADFVE